MNHRILPLSVSASRPTPRISEAFAALSLALDLGRGERLGHSLRACLIGMHLADRLGLPLGDARDLYFALLLKDVGATSVSPLLTSILDADDRLVQRDLRRTDAPPALALAALAARHAAPGRRWFERAERTFSVSMRGPAFAREIAARRASHGAAVVTRLGFGPHVAEALRAAEERWDGSGLPEGTRGGQIPILARILDLATVLELRAAAVGPRAALDSLRRGARRFDPTLRSACLELEGALSLWCALGEDELREAALEREPGEATVLAGPAVLDTIAHEFAGIVDAKSPYMTGHSARVAELSRRICERLGTGPLSIAELRRAALLHDLGTLAVSNHVLDKRGPLTSTEWDAVRLHPYYSQRVLERIPGFEAVAVVAGCHHERLDGRGYFRGLRREQVPHGARVLAAADIFDALGTERPWRAALAPQDALRMLARDRTVGLDPACVDALRDVVHEGAREAPESDLRAAA